MEALTLNLTEVVKRQNPKSKKGFNQVWLSLLAATSSGALLGMCVHMYIRVCMR